MTIEANIAWPNVRRSLFKMNSSNPDSKTRCFVHHAFNYHSQDSEVAAAYMECADKAIWAQQNAPSTHHPDALFMPITYLYRHAIELTLKNLIRTMHYARRVPKLPVKALSEHRIMPLWNVINPILKATWPDADVKPLKNTESLLNELHELDMSGERLRYSYQKSGNYNFLDYPEIIDLKVLSLAMNEIYTLLSCCNNHYHDEWQNQE